MLDQRTIEIVKSTSTSIKGARGRNYKNFL